MDGNNLMNMRPVRIAGYSGGNTDRWDAISAFAEDASINAIIGDWLSESNMAASAAIKADSLLKTEAADSSRPAYAFEFLQCFEPAIPKLVSNKTKLVVNAGAADTERLAIKCKEILQNTGHSLNIAWIEGDDITSKLKEQLQHRRGYPVLLSDPVEIETGTELLLAQCYLGSWGITRALNKGADVVICGRVSNASPVVGVAAWWHKWSETDFDSLAGALIAGHLIECSGYATGGNFAGFKELLKAKQHLKVSFPIAEIEPNGEFVISKERNTGRCVTIPSLISQLVYEIQGPWYLNSDVVADISNVSMKQISAEQVRVTRVKGMPPPPTTKVGITSRGGYQAEFHAFMAGLDINEKCKWTEEQIRYAIGKDVSRLSLLKFHRIGSAASDTNCQDHATVLFRVFAQAKDPAVFRTDVPNGLFRWCMSTFLQSCPALTPSNDARQVSAKPYNNYTTALIEQKELEHKVHCLFGQRLVAQIGAPIVTRRYKGQPSSNTENPVDLAAFGETVKATLGSVVFGRSGDKGADCNVGFFVRDKDEWDWLRSYMSVDRIKSLLGPVEYSGNGVERSEMPHILTVHFLLRGHLDRGYNSSSSVDVLGKNTCEFLLSKVVDIPKVFMGRACL